MRIEGLRPSTDTGIEMRLSASSEKEEKKKGRNQKGLESQGSKLGNNAIVSEHGPKSLD